MKSDPNAECHVLSPADSFEGKQGLNYSDAISAESVGSTGICMHLMNMPAGARANAHMHESHETTIYVLSGEVGTHFGANLEKQFVAKKGDFVYIPAGVPHLPYNLSDTEPASAVIARTDPNEQESVVLLPELDKIHSESVR
jgi:uncharacterized RmlC-like cupin family protein